MDLFFPLMGLEPGDRVAEMVWGESNRAVNPHLGLVTLLSPVHRTQLAFAPKKGSGQASVSRVRRLQRNGVI